MKIIFLISLVLLFTIPPAYSQLLSDSTGLLNRLDVQTGGRSFEVETISNFDITNYEFNADEKKLVIYINAGLEKSLTDILIPKSLLDGNFTFYLNDQELFPKVRSNEEISFVNMNFTGIGNHTLAIIGTSYLDGLTEVDESEIMETEKLENKEKKGDSVVWLATAIIIALASILLIVILKKRK
ncbi:MAG: hypothetical protein HKM23_07450 [Nitrosopumilus sp.]|nr:hypothetical protein [Nitrosopumilus sp.]NNL58949.1 hypothetical protein [Nitrosopumilus sp.]